MKVRLFRNALVPEFSVSHKVRGRNKRGSLEVLFYVTDASKCFGRSERSVSLFSSTRLLLQKMYFISLHQCFYCYFLPAFSTYISFFFSFFISDSRVYFSLCLATCLVSVSFNFPLFHSIFAHIFSYYIHRVGCISATWLNAPVPNPG
jgi:hypothetical protein